MACYSLPMNTATHAPTRAIGLVGFDGDDTLWKSEDFYRKAEQDYLQLLAGCIGAHDVLMSERHRMQGRSYRRAGSCLRRKVRRAPGCCLVTVVGAA